MTPRTIPRWLAASTTLVALFKRSVQVSYNGSVLPIKSTIRPSNHMQSLHRAWDKVPNNASNVGSRETDFGSSYVWTCRPQAYLRGDYGEKPPLCPRRSAIYFDRT